MVRRASTICSSLTTAAKVRECCSNLKSDYVLSDAMRTASVLFYRLTGRQSKYAGTCVSTIRPCFPQMCNCRNLCCSCELDFIRLPGVCEIVSISINGSIVDPASYKLQDDKLVKNFGSWPAVQNLGFNSAPLRVYTETPFNPVDDDMVVTRNTDGTFSFSTVFTGAGTKVVVVTGTEGEWIIPGAGLISGGYDPSLVTTGDWEIAFNSLLMNKWVPTGNSWDGTLTLSDITATYRTYFTRPFFNDFDDPEGTFQITYKTGCNIPLEVQDAVGVLACEIAKARCGDEACRLRSDLRSFTLDGDAISGTDFMAYIGDGLTGIPEVDRLIVSINPNKLYRRGRILSGYTWDRRTSKFL